MVEIYVKEKVFGVFFLSFFLTSVSIAGIFFSKAPVGTGENGGAARSGPGPASVPPGGRGTRASECSRVPAGQFQPISQALKNRESKYKHR